MPRSRHTAATSSESVATSTGSISPLSLAARHTHSTIGRPAIARKTLRLSRVDPNRAGITPAILAEIVILMSVTGAQPANHTFTPAAVGSHTDLVHAGNTAGGA